MQSRTFLAKVHGGRILTEVPLTEFEGKQVYVTLIAPGNLSDAEEERSATPPTAEEAAILEDTGRIRLPRREVSTVSVDIVSVGRRQPRVSTEEE
jgi:hypothetical protein